MILSNLELMIFKAKFQGDTLILSLFISVQHRSFLNKGRSNETSKKYSKKQEIIATAKPQDFQKIPLFSRL